MVLECDLLFHREKRFSLIPLNGTRGVLLGGHFVKLEEPWTEDQLCPGKRVVLWPRLPNSLYC